MPRRVHVELDPVLLGVEEIGRQRVAVGHRPEVLHLRLALEIAVERPQRRQAVHEERKLVHHVEREVGRPAGRKHQLVVLPRVAGHKRDLAAALQPRAPVADGEAYDAGVEIHHAIHVGDVNAGVGECERKRHRFLLLRRDPPPIDARSDGRGSIA